MSADELGCLGTAFTVAITPAAVLCGTCKVVFSFPVGFSLTSFRLKDKAATEECFAVLCDLLADGRKCGFLHLHCRTHRALSQVFLDLRTSE